MRSAGLTGVLIHQTQIVQRIAVIGTSGSGKTTLARSLATRLDLSHLELDSIFHQAGWEPLGTEAFQEQVRAFCDGPRWVTCGKYSAVRPILFARADTIVCLDHHRVRQTARVARRTLRRIARREELWNGNRERVRNLWPFGDPEHTIVGWTWANVPRARALFDELEDRPPHPGVGIVRLRGFDEIDRFLADAT